MFFSKSDPGEDFVELSRECPTWEGLVDGALRKSDGSKGVLGIAINMDK
jgi:hypothetical protein